MKSTLIPVTKIELQGYDEDDKKMSAINTTIIKMDWVIDVADVFAFGKTALLDIYKKKKLQPLELWFTNGDSMLIEYDLIEFTKLFAASRDLELPPEDEIELTASAS